MAKKEFGSKVKNAGSNALNKNNKQVELLEEYKSVDPKILTDYQDNFEMFGNYDDETFQKLKEDIEISGLTENIVTRRIGENRYEIISGHRRRKALVELGIEKTDIKIIECSDEDARLKWLSANTKRRTELTTMQKVKCLEEEKAIIENKIRKGELKGKATKIMAESQEAETGEKVSSRTLERMLKLGDLIPEYQEMVDNGKLDQGKAISLSNMSPKDQKDIYEIMKTSINDLKVSEVKKLQEEKKALEGIVENQKDEMNKIQDQHKDVSNKYTSLYGELQKEKANSSSNKEEIERKEKKLKSLESEMSELKKKMSDKEEENKEAIRIELEAQMKKELAEKDSTIHELKGKIEETSKTKDSEIKELKKKLEEIERQKEEKEGEESIVETVSKLEIAKNIITGAIGNIDIAHEDIKEKLIEISGVVSGLI